MPFYIDIHKLDGISIEDVKKAYKICLSDQDHFGVTCHQFWINKEAALSFCLMESPNMESCKKAHQNAYGSMSGDIIKLEINDFKILVEDSPAIEQGWLMNSPNYYHIIVIYIHSIPFMHYDEYESSWLLVKLKNEVLDEIARHHGRLVEKLEHEEIIGVFSSAIDAVKCACQLQDSFTDWNNHTITDSPKRISFRVGLQTMNPISVDNDLFEKAVIAAKRLCLIAKENKVLASSATRIISRYEIECQLKSISARQESFIHQLFDVIERNMASANFGIEFLVKKMGVSRTQLYRKILAISGLSPNEFISAIRMNKALSLIRNSYGNVSEIALEVGYQNPSYFSKCFQKNFGYTPSEYLKHSDFSV